jgi:hypothetical protein
VATFTPTVGSTVIIFYAFGPTVAYAATHFDANFLLIDNRSGSQFNFNLASVSMPQGTWDNAPTSLIAAHTGRAPEIRVSAATTLTPIWNTFIDGQLAASGGTKAKVSRQGNPSWAWVPFPVGIQNLLSYRTYLRVYQPLYIELEDLPDYTASITYYLRLMVAKGVISGWVQHWEYWVESGALSEYVGAVLQPYTMLGAEKLNDLLAGGALSGLLPAGVTATDLYFLPGDQRVAATAGGVANVVQGFADGDATIVVQ